MIYYTLRKSVNNLQHNQEVINKRVPPHAHLVLISKYSVAEGRACIVLCREARRRANDKNSIREYVGLENRDGYL